jgi:hypothetical protein
MPALGLRAFMPKDMAALYSGFNSPDFTSSLTPPDPDGIAKVQDVEDCRR